MKKCINCGEILNNGDIIGDYCVYCYNGDEIEEEKKKLKIVVFKGTYYYNFGDSKTINISNAPVSIINYRSANTINCFTVNNGIKDLVELERHVVSFASTNNLYDELFHDLSLYTGHGLAHKIAEELDNNMNISQRYIMAKYDSMKYSDDIISIKDTAGNKFKVFISNEQIYKIEG